MNPTTFAPSPFLNPGPTTQEGSLAILHLGRDLLIPVTLRRYTNGEETVTNTRFGSFPHSTLIGLPWGSQVAASKVDTGGRGRPSKKRKRDDGDEARNGEGEGAETQPPRALGAGAVIASSGFIHVLPPTPELWTSALPHRTQVVYTPDYSYIIQRMQVRPGSVLIEAGAGSGSFSHAAARAVFNGYPSVGADEADGVGARGRKRYGKVYSFEFHEGRVKSLQGEIEEHGLSEIIQLTHRDVCTEGFSLADAADAGSEPEPQADSVFLDLPMPWLALKHLARSKPPAKSAADTPATEALPKDDAGSATTTSKPFHSPLNPLRPVHLCSFSPCIEQVQRTVATLRALGWVEISMFELAQRRIEVRRDRIGLHEEGLRGVNATPATVEEAVQRLKEIEGRWAERNAVSAAAADGLAAQGGDEEDREEVEQMEKSERGEGQGAAKPAGARKHMSKQERLVHIKAKAVTRPLYKEGRLVHRTEPELKTHTSYLVFAVLPREWTAEDEERCRQQWPVKPKEGEQEQP